MKLIVCALLMVALLYPRPLSAADPIEEAGVGIGITAGNMWFVPIKVISVAMGLTSGAASFVFSGGNAELTRQIWRDTTQGPYLITPELARKAIGERPELEKE